MFLLHHLLSKFGYQTETYKAEIFKSEHPHHIAISTKIYDAIGKTHDRMDYSWKKHLISDIKGQGVFFARSKQKVYVEVGKVEMNIQIDEYTVGHTASKHRGMRCIHECSPTYHVVFDAVANAAYRFRFNSDKHEFEIVYEQGDEHKIYSFI